MIKLKLTDPTKLENEVEEYVLEESGEVILTRNYKSGEYYSKPVKWLDYSGKVNSRVIGYLKVESHRARDSFSELRSKSDLSSFNKNPSIGLNLVTITNSIFNIEGEVSSLSIEELVSPFDITSIPQEQREPVR